MVFYLPEYKMTNVTEIKQLFNQLEYVGLKVPREFNKSSDLETSYPGDLAASGNFEYLRTRHSWSRILFPSGTEESSYYGGIAVKLLLSQGKCDLKICGLPCSHDAPLLSKEEKSVVVVPTFHTESCKMADRKVSRCRSEKSKEASGNLCWIAKSRIMSEKKSNQKPIIEEKKQKVCDQAKVAKPSRTLEELEESRKIVTNLQEDQKPDTDLKANLTGQNQKLIAFRRITVSGTFDANMILSLQTNKRIQSKQVTKQFLQLINQTEEAPLITSLLLSCSAMMMSMLFDKMLYEQEDFIYSAMDELYWDDEVYEMVEIGVSGCGWLSADDPVFWCVAPANLEEIVWLFRTAPTRQPYDESELPLTLLEYYLRMDLSELLDKLSLAPKRIHDALCMTWARVTKRRTLSTENLLKQSSRSEIKWLFEQDLTNLKF